MNKGGISVYSSRGPSDSPVDEFRGIVDIKTSLSALCSVMNSFSDYPCWYYKCILGQDVKKLNDKEGYVYLIYQIPWPYNDRDLIVRYELTQREDRTVFIDIKGNPEELKNNPEFISEKKGLIRIYKASGRWRFAPKKDGFIEVEYQLYMEPRGNLPAWLANKYLAYIPHYTLRNLCEEVKKPQHVSASIDWLR